MLTLIDNDPTPAVQEELFGLPGAAANFADFSENPLFAWVHATEVAHSHGGRCFKLRARIGGRNAGRRRKALRDPAPAHRA